MENLKFNGKRKMKVYWDLIRFRPESAPVVNKYIDIIKAANDVNIIIFIIELTLINTYSLINTRSLWPL